ncbi:hypothetical protein DPMN_130719 [Dreissena polymorpha]|uniref:Uncharacterized protein n=1 Tax=Dreissena polymorpha TaxID=45954 RepID=A0A9D4HBI2_DREPO|nr:hypothetical protein DPMN_130719 [Dreissena polymorpha]
MKFANVGATRGHDSCTSQGHNRYGTTVRIKQIVCTACKRNEQGLSGIKSIKEIAVKEVVVFGANLTRIT